MKGILVKILRVLKPSSTDEEQMLREQVRGERAVLEHHKARATRVLRDFHAADEVIRGQGAKNG